MRPLANKFIYVVLLNLFNISAETKKPFSFVSALAYMASRASYEAEISMSKWNVLQFFVHLEYDPITALMLACILRPLARGTITGLIFFATDTFLIVSGVQCNYTKLVFVVGLYNYFADGSFPAITASLMSRGA